MMAPLKESKVCVSYDTLFTEIRKSNQLVPLTHVRGARLLYFSS